MRDKTHQWVKDEVLVPCFVYFFDVAPDKAMVDINYPPTRTHGSDDREIARRLSHWMNTQGRGKYCDRYRYKNDGSYSRAPQSGSW